MGLAPPEVVRAATDEYIKSQNVVSNWIEERCDIGYGLKALSNDLYGDFKQWAHNCGEENLKQVDFNKALEDLGYCKRATNIGKVWDGLKPRSDGSNGFEP
jgi:putative DNA primase/helicase